MALGFFCLYLCALLPIAFNAKVLNCCLICRHGVIPKMSFKDQAAVLIPLKGEGEAEQMLLTKRSEHLSIHKGEVAFPGGKWEGSDKDLCATALRESHEEVGLPPDAVDVLGQLPVAWTRQGMRVTPFIGRLNCEVNLTANEQELDHMFWVPLRFFEEDKRVQTDVFHYAGKEVWAPAYDFEGFRIWGFTSRVIVDFMVRFKGASIPQENPAPRVYFKV